MNTPENMAAHLVVERWPEHLEVLERLGATIKVAVRPRGTTRVVVATMKILRVEEV